MVIRSSSICHVESHQYMHVGKIFPYLFTDRQSTCAEKGQGIRW